MDGIALHELRHRVFAATVMVVTLMCYHCYQVHNTAVIVDRCGQDHPALGVRKEVHPVHVDERGRH